jgi:hypothetical protein
MTSIVPPRATPPPIRSKFHTRTTRAAESEQVRVLTATCKDKCLVSIVLLNGSAVGGRLATFNQYSLVLSPPNDGHDLLILQVWNRERRPQAAAGHRSSRGMTIPAHPFSQLFPLVEGAQFEELVQDISKNGLLEPICLHPDGQILDGRNRYRACAKAGIKPRFREWNGNGSAVEFVVSMNLKNDATSTRASGPA